MLKEQFNILSRREQQIILIASPVIICLLIWLVVIEPSFEENKTLKQKLHTKQIDLSWMQQASEKIKLNGSQPSEQNNDQPTSLRQLVTQLFTQHKINLNRIQEDGDEVSIWVDNEPFNKLLSAIQATSLQGLKISQAQISKTDKLGIVGARLTLKSSVKTQ